MIYKVTKRYGRGPETQAGTFKTIPEAKAFIKTAIEEDRKLKLAVTYSIYEGADLVEEIDSSKMEEPAHSEQSESQSSQSKGTGQRFSPSPLSTRPLPKGMPQPSWKDEEEENNK